ncbi:MAG: 50S ribosomal protein L25, partial [Paludibacteraceae bacterium]|nr:50S ribosomal protein L25 [Paludibacteraceae bacterium]
MKTIEIKGTARTAGGKKLAKQMRKQGMIPCNIYGEKKDEIGLPEATAFAVSESELRKLLYTPDIYTVKLDIDGKQCLAIL